MQGSQKPYCLAWVGVNIAAVAVQKVLPVALGTAVFILVFSFQQVCDICSRGGGGWGFPGVFNQVYRQEVIPGCSPLVFSNNMFSLGSKA